MTQRTSRLLVGAAALAAVAALAVTAGFQLTSSSSGVSTATDAAIQVVVVIALMVNLVVGAVVTLARRHNPVGWLFLGLGLVLVLEGPADAYVTSVEHGHRATDSLPTLTRAIIVLTGSTWILWFTIVALILLLTPTGRHLSSRWRVVARVQAGAGLTAFLAGIPSEKTLDPPYERVHNPMALKAIQPWSDLVGTVCVYTIGLGLIASGISLVLRFRRARADDRRQLLWLVFAVAPLPLYVVVAFVTSRNGADWLTTIASGGFITLIPIAAGLSVLRFRLYDVERIVSTTITWALLSAILMATYALIVWLGATSVPSGSLPPEVAATVGAVVAAGLAYPLRQALQDQADRRFNRRAYDARRVIGAALAREDAGMDVEAVLSEALRDSSLSVSYPRPDGSWDDAAARADSFLDVDRHGRVIARIGFDPALTDIGAVQRAAALAASELDNTRLRAELIGRLEEIAASRARLANAQRTERRRIERDLHDGAQQSLLALAFELQSARVNGDPERMRAALTTGATAARDAVRDLRELANGLHPAALADGGLSAALDDMARHSPVPLHLEVLPERLDPALEFTAWLVLGEAIVNAQKHAEAHTIDVAVVRSHGHVQLRVADDGRGGARPDGPGLRGMRDRVETASGELTVSTGAAGTIIEAVLPCGS